jgi:hypothetical protein
MTENWITGILEHLHSCNSTLKITVKWKPLPSCQNDVAVMEALTETEDFFRQRSQRYQSLQDIPSGLLHLRYIHARWARNHSMGTEGKTRWRKEVVLGMASSTTANLVESMEIGTRILSTRWLCCTAIRRLARTASPTFGMVPRL